MDDGLVTALRMAERLLVVGFGGMAIYLGYNLFFHLPHQADHEGKLEFPGIKIVLSRVGPGVFFLAFGATILIYNLDKGIELKTSSKSIVNNPEEITRTFVGATNFSGNDYGNSIVQRRLAAIEHIGALNCLIQMLETRSVEIPATLLIAHHDAKVALLKQVWNEQAWGDIKALEFGSDSIINKNLKGVFTDVPDSCEYQSN